MRKKKLRNVLYASFAGLCFIYSRELGRSMLESSERLAYLAGGSSSASVKISTADRTEGATPIFLPIFTNTLACLAYWKSGRGALPLYAATLRNVAYVYGNRNTIFHFILFYEMLPRRFYRKPLQFFSPHFFSTSSLYCAHIHSHRRPRQLNFLFHFLCVSSFLFFSYHLF